MGFSAEKALFEPDRRQLPVGPTACPISHWPKLRRGGPNWPTAGFVDTDIGCFKKPGATYTATEVWRAINTEFARLRTWGERDPGAARSGRRRSSAGLQRPRSGEARTA